MAQVSVVMPQVHVRAQGTACSGFSAFLLEAAAAAGDEEPDRHPVALLPLSGALAVMVLQCYCL
jgi:hypothetical protein